LVMELDGRVTLTLQGGQVVGVRPLLRDLEPQAKGQLVSLLDPVRRDEQIRVPHEAEPRMPVHHEAEGRALHQEVGDRCSAEGLEDEREVVHLDPMPEHRVVAVGPESVLDRWRACIAVRQDRLT